MLHAFWTSSTEMNPHEFIQTGGSLPPRWAIVCCSTMRPAATWCRRSAAMRCDRAGMHHTSLYHQQ